MLGFVPLVFGIVIGWIFLGAKARKKEINQPPIRKYDAASIDAVTEFRPIYGGGSARYWKTAVLAPIAVRLNQMNVKLMSQVNMPEGPILMYELTKGMGYNAGVTAQAAIAKGHACLTNLAVYLGSPEDGVMVLVPENYKGEFASLNRDLAILVDSTQGIGKLGNTGTFTPGQTPPETPWTTPPVYDGPPGSKTPGTSAPPTQKPPTGAPPYWSPPDTTTPTETPPKSKYDLDSNMSELEKKAAIMFLDDPTASAPACDLAADAASLKGYPKFAKLCREKAARIRGTAQPPEGGPPVPGDTTPPVSTVVTYTIKEGDIPYMMATKYSPSKSGIKYKDFIPANAHLGMKEKNVVVNGVTTTMLTPWYGGLQIHWPAGWAPPSGASTTTVPTITEPGDTYSDRKTPYGEITV